jgi:hypothetical protein
MHAFAPLEKIFFLVGAAFLSVLGHVHTGSLAKAGKNPPDHTLKRHGLRRVFSVKFVPGQSLRNALSIAMHGMRGFYSAVI